MQRFGTRALGLLTLAAVAGALALVGPRPQPAVEPAALAPTSPAAARATHGPQHTVPAEERATVRPLTSSRSPCLVRGIVRTPDGAPVAGADVVLRSLVEAGSREEQDEASEDQESAVSDENGRFELASQPGDYALHASTDARSSNVLEPLSLAPGEQIDELELVLSGGSVLSGLVIDEHGEPVEASLEVRLAGHDEPIRRGDAGAGGAFELTGMPDAALIVVATSDSDGARVERRLSHPEPDLILRLGSPLGAITILVVDPAGRPLPGAYVTAHSGTLHSGMSADEDGTTRFQPSAPEVELSAESDDGVSETVHVVADTSERTVRLVVLRGASVHGRVLAATGEAASGYAVLERRGPGGAVEDAGHVSLDDTGGYRLGPLVPGRYTLCYANDDDERVEGVAPLTFALAAGEETELPELRLPRGRRISGIVRGLDGEPAAEVDVELVDARERSTSSRHIETDAEGRYSVEDVIGPVRLRAAGEDGAISDIAVASASGDEQIELALRATGDVDGVLRGRGGKSARVRCAGGLWHEVEKNGQYHVPCTVGATLEIESEGTVRSYPVEVEEDGSTYVELRW